MISIIITGLTFSDARILDNNMAIEYSFFFHVRGKECPIIVPQGKLYFKKNTLLYHDYQS